MNFETFLSRLPELHSWDGGITWNTGGFGDEHLRELINFLHKQLPAIPVLLETGAGCSTIAFLFLKPLRLTSIAPSTQLFDRVRSYCRAQELDFTALQGLVGYSEWILPKLCEPLEKVASVDFALIDGGHGWPTPFVDFYYINYLVRRGGYIMVDDLQLHSIKELVRLLILQPGFEIALDLGKALVFRKLTGERTLPDWTEQPYIVERTALTANSMSPFSI